MTISSLIHPLRNELTRDGRWRILFAVSIGWFLSIGVRTMYPAIMPYIQTDLNISHTTTGIFLTVLWSAYAIGQLPSGMFSDRFGEELSLLVSVVISALALGLIVATQSVTTLFVFTIFFGLSTSLFGVARFTILSRLYSHREGTAVGITMAAGDLGNAILPPVAGLLAAIFTWQFGFGFVIPLFAVATVALWAWLPRQNYRASARNWNQTSFSVDHTFSGLAQRSILVISLIQLICFSIWQGFVGFYPLYLIEIKNIVPSMASIIFGFFFILGVLMKPYAGNAYDRYGARRSLPVMMGAIILGVLSLFFVETLPGIILATVLLSGMLAITPITITFLTSELPEKLKGTGLGLLRTIYIMVGSFSPTLIGILADRGHFEHSFLLFIVAAGVVIAIALIGLIE